MDTEIANICAQDTFSYYYSARGYIVHKVVTFMLLAKTKCYARMNN